MKRVEASDVSLTLGVARLQKSARGIEARDPIHGHLLGVFEAEPPHRFIIKRGEQYVIVNAPAAS